MKLAHFDGGNGPEIGIVSDGIIPIALLLPDAPRDLMSLITDWAIWGPQLATLATRTADLAIEDASRANPEAGEDTWYWPQLCRSYCGVGA
jgi:hypothetical protein